MPLNTSDLDSIWPVLVRARERRAIGPERAAKLSERERSGKRACEKTMERERSEEREGHGVGTER